MDRYEKALELARAYYDKDANAFLDTIFPELKENEDERIRKTLINALKTPKSVGELKFVLPEPTREECITYLEKQKKRGPLTKEEEYILHRIIEYLEDETCPSEWISLLHDIYCLPYEKQEDHFRDDTKMVEQKPAEWSEEDEKKIHFLSRLIEFQVKDGEYCFGEGSCAISKQEAIEMLKSLRSSWKPSEEQIEALERCVEYLEESDNEDADILAGLCEHLKKLM